MNLAEAGLAPITTLTRRTPLVSNTHQVSSEEVTARTELRVGDATPLGHMTTTSPEPARAERLLTDHNRIWELFCAAIEAGIQPIE